MTPGASLTVGNPVVPGQPINVTWGVVASPAMGNVVATISFGNTVLYTSKPLPIKKYIFIGGYSGAVESVSLQFTPTSAAAQAGLYSIQTGPFAKTLTLSVVGDGQLKGPFTASAPLVVVGENLDASWWNWLPLGPLTWNTPYSVGGNFFNRSQWSAMKVQLTLLETDVLTNQSANRGTPSAITQPVGPNPIEVVFPPITQNWQWVSCPSGTSGGPSAKQFDYSALIQIQDSWGNNYAPLTVGTLNQWVQVPHNKLVLRGGAAAAFGAAIGAGSAGLILGIFSFGVGAAVGGAAFASLMATAAALCGQAQDPPTPDFKYGETAKLLIYPLPMLPADATQLPATWILLKAILECIAIADALGRTEGKLLAARTARDKNGIKLQTMSYKDLMKRLMTKAKTLAAGMDKAARELSAEAAFSVTNTRDAVRYMQLYGIPDSFRKALAGTGCSCGHEKALEQFINAADTATLPSLTESLATLANSVLWNAHYMEQEASKVLRQG